MMARTTDGERLEYLRLFKGALEAHRAQGDDLDDVIRRLDRVIAKREKKVQHV
jgi:Flp pilus assembly protein TadB